MACPHKDFESNRNRFGSYTTVISCQSSAKTCLECDLLLRVVEEYKPGWLDAGHVDSRWRRVLYLEYSVESPGVIRLIEDPLGHFCEKRWASLKALEPVGSFRFFRKAGGVTLSRRDRSQSRTIPWESLKIVKDSSSIAAFERASKWLAHCVDHDEKCRIPNPSFTPRRLLNVGTAEQNREPFLFEPTVPVLYVCLSYCWGADTTGVLTTTKDNLQSHYQAVPLVSMPQTIRDAVMLCRALKLENLWVDSLCITQDDTDDWLQQSSEMKDIYANAHLTVAAEEPASCKLGFLGEQQFGKPGWQFELTTHVSEEAGEPDNQILLRPIKEGGTPDDEYERCSLDKRGWCLQESILPSRRLCFNGKEMTWQCGRRRICECGHALWASPPMSHERVGHMIEQDYGTIPWFSKTPGDDWRSLVQEYSKRSLTKGTDKLSAISGLAKLAVEAPQTQDPDVDSRGSWADPPPPRLTADDYKAGLWKSTFISDLTWCAVKPGSAYRGSIPYRAPSWSWASVDGPVRFQDYENVLYWAYTVTRCIDCTVNDIFCENVDPADPTGPVKAAFAILAGPLVTAELVDTIPALDDSFAAHRSYVRGKNLYEVEVALDQPRKNFKDHIYCFRLFTWEANVGGDRMTPEVWFLVLQKSPRDEAAFQRIGVGSWKSERHGERDYDLPLFDDAESAVIKIV